MPPPPPDIPPRLAVALGLALGCGDFAETTKETDFYACLDYVTDTDVDADTDTDADTDADTDTDADADTSSDTSADTGAGTGDTGTVARRRALECPPSEVVLESILDSGVLPEDVAARLSASASEQP